MALWSEAIHLPKGHPAGFLTLERAQRLDCPSVIESRTPVSHLGNSESATMGSRVFLLSCEGFFSDRVAHLLLTKVDSTVHMAWALVLPSSDVSPNADP